MARKWMAISSNSLQVIDSLLMLMDAVYQLVVWWAVSDYLFQFFRLTPTIFEKFPFSSVDQPNDKIPKFHYQVKKLSMKRSENFQQRYCCIIFQLNFLGPEMFKIWSRKMFVSRHFEIFSHYWPDGFQTMLDGLKISTWESQLEIVTFKSDFQLNCIIRNYWIKKVSTCKRGYNKSAASANKLKQRTFVQRFYENSKLSSAFLRKGIIFPNSWIRNLMKFCCN